MEAHPGLIVFPGQEVLGARNLHTTGLIRVHAVLPQPTGIRVVDHTGMVSLIILQPDRHLSKVRQRGGRNGVQIHVDGDWHEAKVGVVYELDSRGHAAHSRFTATLETSREFGPRLVVLAHQAGSDHCRDLAVVADGGPWIWQETGKYFPGSVQALDYYHASGHLWAAARSRYGEGTSAAGDWAKTLKEQGYHIGSGVVEASCKNVVQSRMKQAGMRWSSSGAEAILHTCSHFHSEGNSDFRQYV